MKKLFWGVILFLVLLIPNKALALNEVNIYFFHSESCDYCKQEKAYLEALKERYFNIKTYYYDVSTDTNNDLMKRAKELYGVKESGIPFTIIGDSTFVGFSQKKKCDMEDAIYNYSYNKYENKFGTNILTIGYRTDLTGDVEKKHDESDYVVEETVEVTTTIKQDTKSPIWDNTKFKASVILGLVGIDLGLVVLIITLLERRRRI